MFFAHHKVLYRCAACTRKPTELCA